MILRKRFTREERSWIMYDWAEAVFTTIMMAAIFPVFFVTVAGGEDSLGSGLWAIGIAVSRVILGVAAPIIGAIISYKGFKKKLFVTFVSLGILVTLLLAATHLYYDDAGAIQGNWQMLLIGYIFALLFRSAASYVYDSYLPDVTTKDRMDMVSTWGFGIGYIGGSTIPFVASILLIMFGPQFGIGMIAAVRISIIMTGLWWGFFSIPMIRDVHHKHQAEIPEGGFLKDALAKVFSTGKKIFKNKTMLFFLAAYFFYIDGVGTIINMATAYGTELGLDAVGMIGALFVTQIVACVFSILFGKLSKTINSINLIVLAICVYIVICIIGFIMGYGLETGAFSTDIAIILFWILAFMVGTVQGGIQAISRSTFGRLVPAENSGEYFGFFEIYGRFSTILGPFLYAAVLNITGRPDLSILSIIVIFLIGLTILLTGRKRLTEALEASK